MQSAPTITIDRLRKIDPLWSKNASSLPVSKTFKCFNGDEFIEGTGSFKGVLVYFDERRCPLVDIDAIKKPAVTLAFISYWKVLDDKLVG